MTPPGLVVGVRVQHQPEGPGEGTGAVGVLVRVILPSSRPSGQPLVTRTTMDKEIVAIRPAFFKLAGHLSIKSRLLITWLWARPDRTGFLEADIDVPVVLHDVDVRASVAELVEGGFLVRTGEKLAVVEGLGLARSEQE